MLEGLNEMQKQAVLHTEGPLLVLAGAGSGKTKVLTHRIAHLINNKNVAPWSILAITFTNKSAKEMKERISGLIGEANTRDMWVSTFHSMCVRILRRDGERLGFNKYFTIYDSSDQKALVKEVMKSKNINEKTLKPSEVIAYISSNKNQFILPNEAITESNFRTKILAEIYLTYQYKLKENNACDFDDLLLNTCVLFQNNPDVLENYQKKFKYILIDEYQDSATRCNMKSIA
ncbi:hypothetical protein AN639_00890 [Candidatus Epulonipiscium fishelsonii]|uniref:Uncharacterized protein n=1 Tax=Candidatus Epulonipiscium fishelsonii TaxID=77094 RepID=A0ACC8XC32_9FIRM|nr:hypothetical protein AN396_01310 [Epulopiscium sp. SCG-B11WGA-EpuloA1]ONI41352.1 hypothetical protein AN639_00890 [Epulopiscium sp. SCG-B05WGA-EpuloA1]